MKETKEEYRFDAPVLRTESGMINHYLPVPDEVGSALWDAGVRRVIAVLNGKEFRRALTGRSDGTRCLIVGGPILRAIGATFGDMVAVLLRADPDPDRVDIPDEFLAVLEEDAEARTRFREMTPGMQRSLCLHVASAKREDTRIKRALELAYKLRTKTLHSDR